MSQLIDGTNLSATISINKQSGTSVTLDTENTFAEKNVVLTLNVQGGSAFTPAVTINAEPTISVNPNTGLITATAGATSSVTPTVSAGWVGSGTAGTVTVSGSNTSQMPVLASTTYNTSTANQTITSGKYLTGNQTIRGVTTANLNATNIKAGVTVKVGDDGDDDRIVGVTGTFTSDATAAASDILSAKTAYVNGSKVTGTIATKSAANLTASGKTVTVPAGYYSTQATKDVATGSAFTPAVTITQNPTITVNANGLVTATYTGSSSITPTVTAGYVATGTAGTVSTSGTKTYQLTSKAAATITPGTTDQTIAAGTYLTGPQTIKGDANLVAGNIADGVTIFGVNGTHSGGGQSGGQIFIHDEVDPVSYDMTFTVNKSLVDNQNYIVYMWFRRLYMYGRINGTSVQRFFENIALPVIINFGEIYSDVCYERLVGEDEFYNIYDGSETPNPYLMHVSLCGTDSEDSSTITYMIDREFGVDDYDYTRHCFQIDTFGVPEIITHGDSGNFNCVLCFMPISSIPT